MTAMGALAGVIGAPPRSTDERRATLSLPWLPLVPLLAIPFLGTSPEALSKVVIAIEVCFLLMGVRNPAWVLAALALSELTVRNYFFTLPAALVISSSQLILNPDVGPRARPLLITATLLTAVSVVATLFADFGRAGELLRSVAPDLAVLALIPVVIRTRDDLVQVGGYVVAIAAASGAIGIAQQIGGARFLSVPHDTLLDVDMVDWGTRSIGLDLNPILLTDHLMLVLFPVAGILLSKALPARWNVVLLAVAGVLIAALFFTQTRSWIFGAGAATVAMGLALRNRTGNELLALLLLAGVGFAVWAGQSGGRYSLGPDSDGSAAARPVLWQAALAMAVDHPVLGVGFDGFKELSPEYAATVDPEALERQNAGEILGRESPHNDFLGVWVSYGTVALVLYALLLAFIAGNFLSVLRSADDALLRGLALGGFGALIAFVVNSFFHNLLTSALTLWIIAGLSIALAKLARGPDAGATEHALEGDAP